MSRQSIPKIPPEALRDVATSERIERVWGRLETEIGPPAERKMRARPMVVWAMAATLAAFGGGLFAGKWVWNRGAPQAPVGVMATHDRTSLDVFAAGSQERTYALPGGGSLTLQPGTMVEVEHEGSGTMRLRLLAGEAAVSTEGAGSPQAFAILAGDATVDANAGSAVRVRHDENNLDVRVDGGLAHLSSPAGTRDLKSGEEVKGVPTRTTTASVPAPPFSRPMPVLASRAQPSEPSKVVSVAVAPSNWLALWQARKFDEARDLLKQQPGGFSGAVANAKSADELMALSDIASGKGGDGAAVIQAWKRVADDFPGTKNAGLAALKLWKHYEQAGQTDLAKQYREQAQTGVFGEDALCAQMRADHKAGKKEEASVRASEYVSKYPNGRCKDEAARIISGEEAPAESDPSTEDADQPAATGSASAAPAPAPTPAPSTPPN